MKIVTVVGARPQFIKAAAVRRAVEKFNKKSPSSSRRSPRKRIEEILVHTGQHYDYLMDRVFFEELGLPTPDHHLGVGSNSHGKQTAMMLERIEAILEKEKPELVLVYGDTNSTLAGALAAAKMKVPVAHVEAGLRSYDREMPEEINRVLTDHLSTYLFCPTPEAVHNLSKEGIGDSRTRAVKEVGDVMYDSIVHYSPIAEEKSMILEDLHLSPNSELQTPNYYLATLHRAENTDDPRRLESVLEALGEIAKRGPVVLPLHPRTRKMMKTHHLVPKDRGIKLIDPVSYLNMLKLEKNAKAILTDSGGVQKEAFWLAVPCITLREVTEWGYTTTKGRNIVSGWRKSSILEAIERIETKRFVQGFLPGMKTEASEKIARLIAARVREA